MKTIITITICLFSALSLFAESGWDKAKNEFQKEAQSSDEFSRANATSKLIDKITPQMEPDATDLLIKQISNELSRAKGGKKEEEVSLKVIDVCVEGLCKMTHDKAVKVILDNATKQSIEWKLRFYLIKVLGGINKPEVIKTLLSLISEKKSPIQVSAFRALGQLRSAEGLESASKLLFSKTNWKVKLAIVEYFRILESPDSFKYLKEVLKHRDDIEPRVFSVALKLLQELSEKIPVDGNNPNQTKGIIMGEYYGVPIESSNIVFLLDTSGSMETPVQDVSAPPEKPKDKVVITGGDQKNGSGDKKPQPPVPEELKRKKAIIDSSPVKTRLDAVKKELINTIYNLDERVNFSIIFYSSGVRPWKIKVIPATFDNKILAIESIERQIPQGSTTIYDALEYAYKITVETSSEKPNSPYLNEDTGGVDTFFLLTDGMPTDGKIIEPAQIVEAIRKINEIRQIKINTIAVGSPVQGQPSSAVDKDFLQKLAEITGGTFVDKTN